MTLASFLRVAALVALFSAPALAGSEVRVADNVFVVPDANAPAVQFTMIIKAGCNDEPHANCHGLAHYLEHLVFLGRNADHKAVAARFFADAETNGWTNERATVFWQKFPARPEGQTGDVEKLFRFYAEHLQKLDVGEEEAVRELKVVQQEYAMRVGRSPGRGFYSGINRMLFPAHPHGQDAIGKKEEIAALTLGEARDFHKTWYTRSNAVFVIHGPVDVEAMRTLAAQYITALPDTSVPEKGWRNALFDFSPMDETVRGSDKDMRETFAGVSRVVRMEEPNRRRAAPARAIASAYLASSLAGSPKEVLVDQKEVAEAIASAGISRLEAGALEASLSVKAKAGVAEDRIIAEIKSYLAGLAETGLPAATVERLKKRIADARAQSAKEPQQVAQSLVDWLAGLNSYQDWLDRDKDLAAVEAADVNAILKAIGQTGRQIASVLSPAP